MHVWRENDPQSIYAKCEQCLSTGEGIKSKFNFLSVISPLFSNFFTTVSINCFYNEKKPESLKENKENGALEFTFFHKCYVIKNIFDGENWWGRYLLLLRNYWNIPVSKTKERRSFCCLLKLLESEKLLEHLFSHSLSTSSPPPYCIYEREMAPTRETGIYLQVWGYTDGTSGLPHQGLSSLKSGGLRAYRHAKPRLQDSIPHGPGQWGARPQTCPHPSPLAPCCPSPSVLLSVGKRPWLAVHIVNLHFIVFHSHYP